MKQKLQNYLNERKTTLTLALITALGIFLFSSIPGSESVGPPAFDVIPIIYHLIAFLIFGFFTLATLKQKPTKKHLIIALSIALIYGALDEFHQTFVTLRHPTIKDVAIDLVGALIGTSAYYKIKN